MEVASSSKKTSSVVSPRKRIIRGSVLLMSMAILAITGFQLYWLRNNYQREKQALELKTNAAFRQTVLRLQTSKLKLDRLQPRWDPVKGSKVMITEKKSAAIRKKPVEEVPVTVLSLIQEKMRDSLLLNGERAVIVSLKNDSVRRLWLDSVEKFDSSLKRKGGVQKVWFSSTYSLPKKIMEEFRINDIKPTKTKSLTIKYETDRPALADTMNFEEGEGVFVSRHLPEPPAGNKLITAFPGEPGGNTVVRFLYDIDSLAQKDSVRLKDIDSAFASRLERENLNVGFTIQRLDSIQNIPAEAVTIGFTKPASFTLNLHSTASYMFGKLKLPILFSIFLVGLTVLSFILLYRNMIRQQRLTELKNEFISNITHELKTPIATVGVAIEALKNFNAIENPERTREYLDISQNELHRLNLLVDKVLKLSMFEKKEVELKYELFDLNDLVDEVVSSMRLQIEKANAKVRVEHEGNTILRADKLHLLSVVFNLLDNALKYSKDSPEINIRLAEEAKDILFSISDNGIGIAQEFQDRIFDKFFRIPHGDTHNSKGYGLGLSYTAHVVRKHHGSIKVESAEETGTVFHIRIPKQTETIS